MFLNLEKINEEVKRYFIPFCEELISAHGRELLSVALYGSAASGEFIPGKSDINSAVVLTHDEFSSLEKSLNAVTAGIKRRIVAPLFLTKSMIDRSVDVFPMEFIEIKENNILMYGDDFFENINISGKHLRLQCEQQIKGKILLLRQSYLESEGKSHVLELLMVNSISSVFPLLRTVLRLKGIVPPVSKEGIIKSIGNDLGIDVSIFDDILRDKRGDGRIGRTECNHAFERYLSALVKLTDIIDAI